MNLSEFDKKFNREFGLKERKSTFEAFKNRILNVIPDDIDLNITLEGRFEFCQFYGIQYDRRSPIAKYILPRLKEESNELEFIKLVALIFNLPWSGGEKKYYAYCMGIIEALKLSKLPYRTMMDDVFLIVPAGNKKLDEELVGPVFSFLDSKSKKHFIEVYKNLLEKKYISVAESLRRSLEEFLRFKFKNGKGLAVNIAELGKLLKTNKVASDIRSIICQTFKYIDSYFNENSKHKDGDITMEDAFFLVYQVANLMHYINNKINI